MRSVAEAKAQFDQEFKRAIVEVGSDIKYIKSDLELANIFNRERIQVEVNRDQVILHFDNIEIKGLPGFGYIGHEPALNTAYWEISNPTATLGKNTIFYTDGTWGPLSVYKAFKFIKETKVPVDLKGDLDDKTSEEIEEMFQGKGILKLGNIVAPKEVWRGILEVAKTF